jgi:hypothetical protein
MTTHVSATALEETPHETETIQITISDALRRRAQAILYDRSIDPQWRSIIRYALIARNISSIGDECGWTDTTTERSGCFGA